MALIGYTVLFNLLVVVAQTKLNRACSALLLSAFTYQLLCVMEHRSCWYAVWRHQLMHA